jgi:hypothetical protein
MQAVTLIFVTRFMQALHMQLALDNFARIQNQNFASSVWATSTTRNQVTLPSGVSPSFVSAGFLGVALSPRALVMGQYFFYSNPPILNWHQRRSSPGFSTFRTALDPSGPCKAKRYSARKM